GSCSEGEFQCVSGEECVNGTLKCDGSFDCLDRSDEADCGPQPPYPTQPSDSLNLKTYPSDQSIKQSREVVFQCRDEGRNRAAVRWVRAGGQRLPPGSTDNRGRLTMPNIQVEHSGTYYCEAQGVPQTSQSRKAVTLTVIPFQIPTVYPTRTACSARESTCRNGECIPKDAVCDGDVDCSDGSDESRCNPLGCEPNEFQCDNKQCVGKAWLCDSDDDCSDGSDERDCDGPAIPGSSCTNYEFSCQTGDQCIPKSFHCDTEIDCQDGSDEFGCSSPTIIEPPIRTLMIDLGETFSIKCKTVGVPTPIVIWRLNWGHVPPSCTMTSEQGYGVLTCVSAKSEHQGAYSCEAINILESVFAEPDTIVQVKKTDAVCKPPQFNVAATTTQDCLSCFCFGITDQCFSAEMGVSQLALPMSEEFQIVGVNQDQFEGNYVIRDRKYPLLPRNLRPLTRTESVQLEVRDRNRLAGPSDLIIYFSLPDTHKGSQLTAYGGYLRYTVQFRSTGGLRHLRGPDVILRGNNVTIMHVHDYEFEANRPNVIDVRFWPGNWYKRVTNIGGRIQSQEPATRYDILSVLENVDLILIRASYVDGSYIDTTLSKVVLDTALHRQTNQGRAVLVEECICPTGYSGLSCENCAQNYQRTNDGPYLGRCVLDIACGLNEYGDPARGISCLPCPCPLTNPANQFSQSCYLDSDGQVTCNCERGYQGRRCEACADGYEGNPTVPGDSCQPVIPECQWFEFICGDMSKCLHKRYRCDGRANCPDGSDETFCTTEPDVDCVTTFTCRDGSVHPWSRRCDGITDCYDNEDEKNCKVCFNSAHLCSDSLCINYERICDGVLDCSDGSDEMQSNCIGSLPCDHLTQWTCADNSCIRSSQHCDGYRDCRDESD
ncbi:UNVERIFIED_CONTAM: hypothetical protein GTU68_063769, partial [Idotea baltica]|nr:hypothetical protein [Idotea baltica]